MFTISFFSVKERGKVQYGIQVKKIQRNLRLQITIRIRNFATSFVFVRRPFTMKTVPFLSFIKMNNDY